MNSVANGKIRERTPFREVFIQPAVRRQRHRAGRGVLRLAPASAAAPRLRHGSRLLGAGSSATPGRRRRSTRRAAGSAPRAARSANWDDEPALDAWTAAQIAAGQRRRLVSGTDGVGRRARSATAASSPIRGGPTCATSSTRRSSSASDSARSRRRSLEEALDDYFVGAVPDPFMLQVYPVRPEKRAVVPGDHARRRHGTAADRQPRARIRATGSLIKAFETLTGVPMLLNTSFNENEPIVLAGGGARLLPAHAHGRARHGPPRRWSGHEHRRQRVLVTGGSGFLGRHVVEGSRKRGCGDVVVVARRSTI